MRYWKQGICKLRAQVKQPERVRYREVQQAIFIQSGKWTGNLWVGSGASRNEGGWEKDSDNPTRSRVWQA